MSKRRSKKQPDIQVVLVLGIALLFLLFVNPASSNNDESSNFWVIIGLVVGILLGAYLFVKYSNGKRNFFEFFKNQLDPAKQATLNEIDAMSGLEFERFVGDMFRQQGYYVEYTKTSGDYGVDLILTKDRIRTAVQTKRYSKPLAQAPVREVVAGMMRYKCSKCMVVTNNTFTVSAQELARSNYCKLIDREQLSRIIISDH